MNTYDLHGVRIGVTATGREIAEQAAAGVHARLAGLPLDGARPDIVFEIYAGDVHAFERPEAARPVYDPPVGEVVYDDGAGLLYIGYGPRLSVLCEPGRARASVIQMAEEDLWSLSHPLFTLPLVELLKRQGLYGLHAGGVCRNGRDGRDGRAMLLPGTSGSGKSTLTLALVRAGFGFLGDDTLFLARRPEGLKVLAFPDEFDLTDQTVAFFPELAPLLDTTRPAGWRKRQIRAEQTYRANGAEVVWECDPALLVFPQVAGVRESRLSPMPKDEALLELAPNVLLTDPESSQAHFDALAELVERSECWRLETGSDLDEAVRILEAL